MPRTIHVTVTYSVHVEDDSMSDRKAKDYALQNYDRVGTVFDTKATVFEKWKELVKKARRGVGSY